jgi:hypothetical protein
MTGFSRFCLFYHVSGVSRQWEFKNTTKKRFTKNRAEKVLQKNQPPPQIFSFFVYHVFGRFSVMGVQKKHKTNIENINPTLVLFWTLTHPPTHGGHRFLLGRPLGC